MPPARPNIIYILADDMGYGDVSCLNEHSKICTAHIDRLGREGLSCRDAHASSAVCTPSRYSILTGRYNFRSQLKAGVTGGYSRPLLETGRMTVGSFLQRHGYHTACIGKWHLGLGWPLRSADHTDIDYGEAITDGPTHHGFDAFFGISASLDMPPYVYIENDRVTAPPDRETAGEKGKRFYRPGPVAPDFDIEQVLPTLTDRAVRYVRQRAAADEPFFLYFPLPAPHTPILPLPEFQGRSGTNAYGDFCLQVDDVVGQLLDVLDEQGIAQNTIIAFTSDNGCSPMADFDELHALGHQPSYVFRGHKADIYEGGHRVPLLIRWPEVIAPGSATDQTLCLTDLLATCAQIVGDTLPDDAGEDSVSNLPVWRGDALSKPLREATVHTSIDGSLSVRQGRWKLEMCAGSGGWSAPKPGPDCAGLPLMQLYDLDADIGERRNLVSERPDIVAQLREVLTTCIRRGRSTPGAEQENWGGCDWQQLWWMRDQGSGS